MPINRPTSKTIISTTGWGIPITDAVNANTDTVAKLTTDIREYWKHASSQSYPGTNLPLNFPTRRDTICSSGTTLAKSGNYFIMAVGGLYLFQYWVQWAASASTATFAAWLYTPANNERYGQSQVVSRTDGEPMGGGAIAIKVAANTQIAVCVYSTTGAGSIQTCEFSAVLLKKD